MITVDKILVQIISKFYGNKNIYAITDDIYELTENLDIILTFRKLLNFFKSFI